MGAAVSARADEVPGQQEKLAALYSSLGVASLSEERKVEFEAQLRELYERHGGDQLFLEEDARKRQALFKLFEKEARELFAEPSLAGASEFRQKRLSYSAAPQRGKSDASLGDGRASGERNRRPSLEFRSPEYDPANPAASPSPETRPLGAKARNAVTVKPGYEASTAPFDGSILGTYSYHGIEPKHYGAGVVSKINQDRGCVVAPYNDSDACSLYCIFDGHGEHGDGVSEFVLATIVQDLEDQNVQNSIEIGKRQIIVADWNASRVQTPKAGPSGDRVAVLLADAPEHVTAAYGECEQLRKAIEKNGRTKGETKKRLRENEKGAERFHAELRNDRRVTSDERRELLELMYRIGNLELGNMQLEQAQVIHSSVVKGKDLTIQKLQLQLLMRDKVIAQQRDILKANDLDSDVGHVGLQLMEQRAMSQNFDTLRSTTPAPHRLGDPDPCNASFGSTAGSNPGGRVMSAASPARVVHVRERSSHKKSHRFAEHSGDALNEATDALEHAKHRRSHSPIDTSNFQRSNRDRSEERDRDDREVHHRRHRRHAPDDDDASSHQRADRHDRRRHAPKDRDRDRLSSLGIAGHSALHRGGFHDADASSNSQAERGDDEASFGAPRDHSRDRPDARDARARDPRDRRGPYGHRAADHSGDDESLTARAYGAPRNRRKRNPNGPKGNRRRPGDPGGGAPRAPRPDGFGGHRDGGPYASNPPSVAGRAAYDAESYRRRSRHARAKQAYGSANPPRALPDGGAGLKRVHPLGGIGEACPPEGEILDRSHASFGHHSRTITPEKAAPLEAEAPPAASIHDEALGGLDLEIHGVHQSRRRASTKGFGNLRAKLAQRRESQSSLDGVRSDAAPDDQNRAPLVDVNGAATASAKPPPSDATAANRLPEPDAIDALFERSSQSVGGAAAANTTSSVA